MICMLNNFSLKEHGLLFFSWSPWAALQIFRSTPMETMCVVGPPLHMADVRLGTDVKKVQTRLAVSAQPFKN